MRPSLILAPLSWFFYLFFYDDWIAQNCSGECNIRIDLLIVYPFLLAVLIRAIIDLTRLEVENEEASNHAKECDQPLKRNRKSIQSHPKNINFSDKYSFKLALYFSLFAITLILAYILWSDLI